MNEIDEYLSLRSNLLDDSKDDGNFITESILLSQILPSMLDAKLLDSEDFNDSYLVNDGENLKLNAYTINESGERLQLFIIDENTILENADNTDLLISERINYENQFKRVERIIRKAFHGNLYNSIQESSGLTPLASHLESIEGIERFDVIEIFLISLTATVTFKGQTVQPRNMHFDSSPTSRKYKQNDTTIEKQVLIIKKLIDLNFLFKVMVSRGYREALLVNFKKTFGYTIEVIKAAEDKNFDSYLCALPAQVIADLYKEYSSRLLEKNVRSFLQFKGVNKEIRTTIKEEPEKFIAYNNGLTITATNAKVYEHRKKTYIESLTDFQIVNGGQTTATIYFSKKDGLDISKVKVMAKINIAKQVDEKELEKLIDNISKFSNAQSRVSKVDLKSRNPQLVKIKSLSESVLTPTGNKWFFERAKGEFNTMLRKAGSNRNRIKKEYPNERKFSKEQMAKFYTAWGDEPYLVKKGGEKVFRHFIERIAPEESESQPLIDRDFYERLIAIIFLFRRMEKIHGQGKNAIGQIRSAVIPYTVSVLYMYSDKVDTPFNMAKIWKDESLEDNFESFLYNLMSLMNTLIKKYSISDDLGEHSKKKELWGKIIASHEIKDFISNTTNGNILKKYIV
mgnify:CR=1 FL=1